MKAAHTMSMEAMLDEERREILALLEGKAIPAVSPPAKDHSAGDSEKARDEFKRARPLTSIACQRCRKAKIRCHNTGSGSPCLTCIKLGKECIYPKFPQAPLKQPEPPIAGPGPSDTPYRIRSMLDIGDDSGPYPAGKGQARIQNRAHALGILSDLSRADLDSAAAMLEDQRQELKSTQGATSEHGRETSKDP